MRLLDLFCGAGGAAVGYHRAGFEVVGVDFEPQPNYPFDFVQMDVFDFLRHGGMHDGRGAHRRHPGTPVGPGILVGGLHRREDGAGGFAVGDLPDPGAGREARQGDVGGAVALADFDAVHASPPCQAHSTLKAVTRHIDHPDLVDATRTLLKGSGLPYVIENVPGAPLRTTVQLCGSSFGLGVRRHRIFETNFPVMGPACAHGMQEARFDRYQHGSWYRSPVVAVYGSGGGKAREHWDEAMGIDWMDTAELAQAIPPAYSEHVGQYLRVEVEARAGAAA